MARAVVRAEHETPSGDAMSVARQPEAPVDEEEKKDEQGMSAPAAVSRSPWRADE